jgi:hypothetical protein
MKFKFLASCAIYLITVFCSQNAEAGFSNSGKMQSKNLNLTVGGTLDNNGELIGTESANIGCDTLSGKGVIRSPQITIQSKLFAYTGIIDCSGKCIITVSSPFNEKMFKRKGGGEFIIIIDEKFDKQANVQHKALMHSDYEISDELQVVVD